VHADRVGRHEVREVTGGRIVLVDVIAAGERDRLDATRLVVVKRDPLIAGAVRDLGREVGIVAESTRNGRILTRRAIAYCE
jgi:hypothetical protein